MEWKEQEKNVQEASCLHYMQIWKQKALLSSLSKQFLFPSLFWGYQDLPALYLSTLLQQANVSHIYKDNVTEIHRY